ncbi:hypothetical protein [Kitasatospora sp. NPDC004289]
MLFGGPACAQCGTELPPPAGSGRPKKYCTKACSKRAERAREAERVEQLKADLKAAESPREEIDPLHGLADDPAAAELLVLAEQLARADRLLLLQMDRATRDRDPALARQALTDVQHSAYAVMQRHRELVEQLRAEHPLLLAEVVPPAAVPAESPRRETTATVGASSGTVVPRPPQPALPYPAATAPQAPGGAAGGSPRGETATVQGAFPAATETTPEPVAPRGETTSLPEPAPRGFAAPRGETAATASTAVPAAVRPTTAASVFTVPHPDDTDLQPDAVLRATADPVLNYGPPDLTADLAASFGPGWTSSSWSAPGAGRIRQLHQHGVRAGWAALLPEGRWGCGGWIAVLLLADGRAEPLLDPDGRPHTFDDQDQALAAVYAGRLTPPATAARTPDPDRPQPRTGGWIGPRVPEPGTVKVPRDPRRRGLPDSMDVHIPLDPALFGYAWELCGWTVQPDVMLVLGEGQQVGWVERGLDGGDGWVAVYEGYFLGDPTTQQALLHDTPELAARSILQAHIHDL